MGFQISLYNFHKNSLSERLLEGKSVALLDELTDHKAVNQKVSFQFLTEIFSFHHIPLWASKYHLANSTRTVLVNGFLRGKL